MIIYLVGLMGAGKTTIGAALASELGYSFHDTDGVIEQKNCLSVSEIFRQKGEDYFRAEEEAVVAALVGKEMVVACGGGLPAFNNLMEVLSERGEMVYLHAKPSLLADRIPLDDTTRPLLTNNSDRLETLRKLYEDRDAIYRKARFTVETEGKSITELIAEIRFLLS